MRRWAVLALLLVVAGCGGSGDDGPVGGADSPARAAAEASEMKTSLDRALEKYREGSRGDASDVFEAGRRDHFSRVEGPLRKVDAALAASLHTSMFTSIPKAIDEGVTVQELAERLADVEVDLDDATVKLRAP